MDEWHPYIDLCENFTSHSAIHLFVRASQFAVLGDSCCEYQLHGRRGLGLGKFWIVHSFIYGRVYQISLPDLTRTMQHIPLTTCQHIRTVIPSFQLDFSDYSKRFTSHFDDASSCHVAQGCSGSHIYHSSGSCTICTFENCALLRYYAANRHFGTTYRSHLQGVKDRDPWRWV